MSDYDELQALRRLAELEAIAGEARPAPAPQQPSAFGAAVRQSLGAAPGGQLLPDIGYGLASSVLGAGQLASRLPFLPPAVAQNVDAATKGAKDWYTRNFAPEAQFGSSVAQGVGAALIPGAALSKLPMAGGAVLRALQSGLAGGATAALEPVTGEDYGREKIKQVAGGTIAGTMLGPAAELAGRALAPRTPANVKDLLANKIYPTIPQLFGSKAAAVENKLTSLPLLGDAIEGGQRAGIEQFNRALYRRALEPLGANAAKAAEAFPVGREGVAKTGNALSDAYDAALAASQSNLVDGPFRTAIGTLRGMVKDSGEFDRLLSNAVWSRAVNPQGGTTAAQLARGQAAQSYLPPSAAKEAESELGRMVRDRIGSSDPNVRETARALAQAQVELRNMVARNNPAQAPVIQAINRGYADLVQIENAAARAGSKEGVITPAQYRAAIKQGDRTVRDRAFARGEALNQDFAQNVEGVIGNRYPDSGTPGRFLTLSPTAWSAGILGSMALGPVYGGVGQKWAARAIAGQRPQMLQALGAPIRDYAPLLAAPASAALGAPLTAGLLGYF